MLQKIIYCLLIGLAWQNSFIYATKPQIIAHRAGTADAPENTIYAIQKSLNNGADAIWITVQLSKDNIPVLYRPSDLNALSDYSGAISTYNYATLNKIDVACKFIRNKSNPYCKKGITIPSLETVLKKWPNTFFFLDLKSPDANPAKFAQALEKVLIKTNGLQRTRVYSTNKDFLAALTNSIKRFVDRDTTRTILSNITMHHQCKLLANNTDKPWFGFEFKRKVKVIETFTLGEGVTESQLEWDTEAIECFRKNQNSHIVLFGINTPEDKQAAYQLGVDGILVDSLVDNQ